MAAEEIEQAVRASIQGESHVVLAVSGGSDSMALLAAFAAVAEDRKRATVASFDHGTGAHATAALALVRRAAEALGIEVRVGRATGLQRREASWRDARWSFLRGVALEKASRILTAHTEDDHLETVVMRELRGAGARGLAGLLATSSISRPFLRLTRQMLVDYCRRRRIDWMDDPSNLDLSFFRNRVRHEILPALCAARTELREELLDLSERAARLRCEIEAAAAQFVEVDAVHRELVVPWDLVADFADDHWRLIWPAILARANVVADRRGIVRLAAWSPTARSGTRVQLSGGFEVLRRRDAFTIRRVQPTSSGTMSLCRIGVTEIGQWRFYPIEVTTIKGTVRLDPWQAALEEGQTYSVREWLPGDRLQATAASAPRRVSRFFEDEGVSGPERIGWPVVALEREVVWIPGVRRGHAATARRGGPYVVYQCERNDSRS